MPPYDFRTPRLFVDNALATGAEVPLDRNQANYLLNVLRVKRGDRVLLFNGRDGEWEASLARTGNRDASLAVNLRVRVQPRAGELYFLFAPLKQARLDYLVQKAVEMGASVLQPVITAHTAVSRLNLERMRANAIEAAEQCGILAVPSIASPLKLESLLKTCETERVIVFCDERASA